MIIVYCLMSLVLHFLLLVLEHQCLGHVDCRLILDKPPVLHHLICAPPGLWVHIEQLRDKGLGRSGDLVPMRPLHGSESAGHYLLLEVGARRKGPLSAQHGVEDNAQ